MTARTLHGNGFTSVRPVTAGIPWTSGQNHRIYVVLQKPPEPWSQTVAQRYPWTSAMDYAIVNANTIGLTDEREAAARMVLHVNGEPLQYDIWQGSPRYYAGGFGGGTFLIVPWLAGFSNGPIVNCYDCASAVTTFSNVVGCELSYQFHGPFGYLDPVYPIGRGLCNNPFYGSALAPYNVPLVGVDDVIVGFGCALVGTPHRAHHDR